MKIIKKDNNLKLENCALDLKTIFENYKGLEDNSLDLISFINEYKLNQSNFEEKNKEKNGQNKALLFHYSNLISGKMPFCYTSRFKI